MLKYFSLLLLPLFAFCLNAQEQTVELGRESRIDSVLASVNGDPVTLLDVMLESGRDESRLASMFTGERLYEETAKVRRKIVEEIVIRKLIYSEYREHPFDIKKQHVEDVVDSIARSMGDGTRAGLERRLKSFGATIREVREKAREKIAVDVLLMEHCDRRVFITPRQVYEYYEANKEKWTSPEQISLQLLLVRKDAGKDTSAIVRDLAKMLEGADESVFSRIARENTEGPNASTGGKIGTIDRGSLRSEFQAALKDAETGTVAGPVETPEGFYFLRVAARIPAVEKPFREVAESIRQELFRAEVEKLRTEYRKKLLRQAVVRYYF